VPLFVFDDTLLTTFGRPNRVAFLLEALADLDASLKGRGGRLVFRRGDVVEETMRVAADTGAEGIFVSEDVSAYARRREQRFARACAEARMALWVFPGVTIVPPGEITPAEHDAFRVFTPYWRRWRDVPRRAEVAAPRQLALPAGVRAGRLPALARLVRGTPSPDLPTGGGSVARRRAETWIRRRLGEYDARRDDLAADATSRLSPYLHFGCISPLSLAARVDGHPGSEAFLCQLCWRDFHHQLSAADLQTAERELRPRHRAWRTDEHALEAWRNGRTGYPIVDAGMRQLTREGWLHNRARLIAGSFLTKALLIDWRHGAAHFFNLLVDGDVANNVGNWQWVAGTGADTRPNRTLNPIRQARRFDPDGAYVRRHVQELRHLRGSEIHTPWRLDRAIAPTYPTPVVDLSRPHASPTRE
jgi:deoxyribodipyrimidine photo-lyase